MRVGYVPFKLFSIFSILIIKAGIFSIINYPDLSYGKTAQLHSLLKLVLKVTVCC